MIDNSKSSERRNDTSVILDFLKTTSGKPETSLTHSNSQIKLPCYYFQECVGALLFFLVCFDNEKVPPIYSH
jgi:hypothetical protein